ncbi:response regulator [Pyrinomonas sp.]|uniref:response regulator n=1 Tax=Pyrinomonas sp. TaxID=2080306 RepID=UPI00331A9242
MGLAKSFLVVDDSATMRMLIIMTLRQMGCQSVIDAPNGRVALEKLATSPVDVVITDVDMPEMNGLEFIRHARQRYANLPILILSAHGDDATRVAGMRLGANGYLTKPLSSAKLIEMLEQIFPDLEM